MRLPVGRQKKDMNQAIYPTIRLLGFQSSNLDADYRWESEDVDQLLSVCLCTAFIFICLNKRGLEWTKTSARTYWSSG